MSTLSELWKNWEGRVADGKFPLRQWLGGSDHSAVFLTERTGSGPQKAAIKLIPADSRKAAQISLWADAAKLSHPHLIRLFEYGRCQIDDTRLLYVVMEYAEENLAEILPLRPLSPAEASADAAARGGSPGLSSQVWICARSHQTLEHHGGRRPVEDFCRQTLQVRGAWRRAHTQRLRCAGDRNGGLSPAADIWSLGVTLLAVLTQNEPNLKNVAREPVVVTRNHFASDSRNRATVPADRSASSAARRATS